MIQRLRFIVLPGLIAAASLFAGLFPTLLDYGRFDPLDWLLPSAVAFAVLRLFAGRSPLRAIGYWALLVLPVLLILLLAASSMPGIRLGLFAALLAAFAFAFHRTPRRPWITIAVSLLLL